MLGGESRVLLLDGSKRCEISGYLFSKVEKFLKVNNFEVSDKTEDCKIAIVNTCCVTQGKISESEFEIDKALNETNIEKIIMLGCLASIPNKYSTSEKYKDKIILIGSKQLSKLDEVFDPRIKIDEIANNTINDKLFTSYQREIDTNDYYILISQGCNYNCSYCNIKLSKGSILSRSENDILDEISEGVKKGYTDFVLLADDCGSYGTDINTNITKLIEKILLNIPDINLKISTVFPSSIIKFKEGFEKVMASRRIKYLNIPIQSGSKRILELMNRNYDVEEIRNIIKQFKEISPETWIYTHIIINFPSETREEFLESFKSATDFDEILIMNFSDNPLTRATKIEPKIGLREQEIRIKMSEKLMQTGYKGIVVGNNHTAEFK